MIADDKEVVLTTGKHAQGCFSGFDFNQKRFSDNWTKIYFEKFNGKITISNN